MRSFGEEMGIAFQIKDDLLDFAPSTVTGKPSGGDVKERKMTLPLIHTLQSLSTLQRRSMVRGIKRSKDNPNEAQRIMERILEGPGMAYAESKMKFHRDRAVALLEPLKDGAAKTALIELVDFTISRKK